MTNKLDEEVSSKPVHEDERMEISLAWKAFLLGEAVKTKNIVPRQRQEQ